MTVLGLRPFSNKQLQTNTWTDAPTVRLLAASFMVAPLLHLAADAVHAARGWDDAVLRREGAWLVPFDLLVRIGNRGPLVSWPGAVGE